MKTRLIGNALAFPLAGFWLGIHVLSSPAVHGADHFKGLEFRARGPDGDFPVPLNDRGTIIPPEAIQSFTYAGEPRIARVASGKINVQYQHCAVRYDRATGRPVQIFTAVNGYPDKLPEDFAPPPSEFKYHKILLVGPGVPEGDPDWTVKRETMPVLSVQFEGQTWTAWQKGVYKGLDSVRPAEQSRDSVSWTSILNALNEKGCIRVSAPDGKDTGIFTMQNGLASNLISHLVVADGTVWAACVDIWDPEKKQWGPGGLCRFDAKTSRWKRVEQIDGHPVRWVTLLQTIGDELWIGYREGEGVEGDRVVLGMGVFPGEYRPKATAMVLARLKQGRFTRYTHPFLSENAPAQPKSTDQASPSPTEKPVCVVPSGDDVFLLTKGSGRAHGSFGVDYYGNIWRLELAGDQWHEFKAEEAFHADKINSLTGEEGEVIAWTNRGAHQWRAEDQSWRFLDSGCPLKNSMLSAATLVGNQLWVGYTNQGFGVLGEQGISCFNEETGTWSYISPEEIGTACPVRQIATVPGGDAWVAFNERPWPGAAEEYSFYAREGKLKRPGGIGHFSKGKWEFPFHPVATGSERWSRRHNYVVTYGEQVCMADGPNLFLGPNPWKLLYSGEIADPEFAAEGKGVVFFRCEYTDHNTELQRGEVELASGKVSFVKVKQEGDVWMEWGRAGLFRRTFSSPWVLIPTKKEGAWGVGPLEEANHAVVETPWAVWIVSNGQLIRLDRKLLKEWLPAQPAPRP